MESFNQKNLTPEQEKTQMTDEISLGEFIAKVKEDLKPTQESPIFFCLMIWGVGDSLPPPKLN